MKNVLQLTALLVCLIASSAANAAARFWVGGTGTWDNATTTHWSASTGGAGGASAPTTGDAVTFDGSSGGGTVTAAANISGLSLLSITMGAFTGTLAFNTNNPNLTITGVNPGFSISGTGARILNMGSSTFTFTGSNGTFWDATTTTGLTLTQGTSTIRINDGLSNNDQTFVGGGKAYANFVVGARAYANGNYVNIDTGNTFSSFTVNGPAPVVFAFNSTTTITGAFVATGTAANAIAFINNSTVSSSLPATISIGAASASTWAAFRNIIFTGAGAASATNSFDLQGNSGITITAPSGGGSGHIIGG